MEYLSIVKIESRFLKYSTSRYSESRILLRIRVEGLEKGSLSFSTLFKKDGKIFHSSIMCTYYKCYLSNIYKILIDIKFILWIDQKLFTRLQIREARAPLVQEWISTESSWTDKINWYNAVVSTRRAINYITNVYKCFRTRIIKLKL